ncbi:hypothetical protein [Curtobacterium sp. MCBA15_005]|uniref:hypothetical protein n=1 Tax=Curtobacterium sp. MCBA15_005 TaxID=1898734 RepID=UPI0008DDF0C3|nr:hypothetical protein [Curtobacterium sp. MCBA15_005]OII00515.1 hypothetical protein BIU89_04950 [Curtobacterium sp. MCBA15_005]
MVDILKISITGKVSYEDEISVAQAARIITFLNSDEGEAVSSDGLDGPAVGFVEPDRQSSNRKKVESPRDAIAISGAKRNPEKIVALGAFVLQDGGDTFKAEDVKAQFRRARENAPGNFSRDLSQAVSAGWIAEEGAGEFYLTTKVDGIFDDGFSFAGGSKTRAPRKTAKAQKAKSKPEIFAGLDEFASTMDGFPPYSKMKFNKDKLLWVLLYAKKHGVKGLANKDVEWITDHIGDGIPNGQITAAFNSAKGPGYANRSTQDQTIRITSDGEAYLATVGAKNDA